MLWLIIALLLGSSPSLLGFSRGEAGEIVTAGESQGEASYSYRYAERCLMREVNRARARRGLRSLKWDPQLSYVARRHAGSLSASRGVYHDPRVGEKVTNWKRLGQNTGRGANCRSLFRSFMSSKAHRTNIFGRWHHMGVGTQTSAGRVYVQQIFESRYDPGNIYNYP